MHVQDALARLLSSSRERRAFYADRDAWVRARAVDDEHGTIVHLNRDQLEEQAGVLLDKRLNELGDFIPRTLRRLGKDARARFREYAETSWPTGHHLRHLNDAVSFLAWLERCAPRAVHGEERAFVEARLCWRRDGRRVYARLAAERDTGPLAAVLVIVSWRGQWSLFFPLPVPSVLLRRRRQRLLTAAA